MSNPEDLSAVEARDLIGRKELSPTELFDACVARTEQTNPALNAVVSMDIDMGREAARAAERAVMAGEPLGALHGIPVAIKDNRAVKGLRTTFGSLLYENHIPDADDPSVIALKAAGAVVFQKTNLPEFGAGANTVNRVFGATGNPFGPHLTSAGSSGGSAAALATGMTPLSTGSDYGGSLRTPAAFCGIAGFRPSLGVCPLSEGAPCSPWGVNGPMARTVADLHLLLTAMAVHEPDAAFSSPDTVIAPLRAADISALRIAFSEDLGAAPVAKAIRTLFHERMGQVESLAGKAAWAEPDFGPIHDVFEITRGVSFLAAHAERVAKHRDLLDRNVIDNCERGMTYSAADVGWAHKEQGLLHRRVLRFFEDFDVLIAPAASVSPFPHSQLFVEEIDGEAMPTYMRWLAISYMPTLALCCSAAVPCGTDANGLPFGIQIIGPPGADNRVMAVAAAVEAVLAQNPASARPTPDIAALSARD